MNAESGVRSIHAGPTRRSVRSIRGPWWIAAGALVLGACGSGDPAADAEGRSAVSPEAVHVIPTPEVVARVADLQPAGDGRVWVLNSMAPFFVALGPDGGVEREFGRPGEGPGEFGAPVALVAGPGPGDVWTYDVVRHALIRVSSEPRRDVRLPRDSLSPGRLVSFAGAGIQPARPWLEPGGGGFLLARTRPGDARPMTALGLWNADIVRIGAEASGASLEVRTPVADLLGDPVSRYAGATSFLPYPLWTVCADGTLALYDPLGNELRRIAGDGSALAPIALPQERRLEVDADRLFTMAFRQIQERVPASQRPDSAGLRRMLEGQLSELARQSADVFPEYADLRCTRDGTLWLQPFDVASGRFGRGPDWYRIAADGSRTRVAFPEAFTPFRFEADRIWGTIQDALDVASVAWIGVDALR